VVKRDVVGERERAQESGQERCCSRGGEGVGEWSRLGEGGRGSDSTDSGVLVLYKCI
jgi:hypothetical protein